MINFSNDIKVMIAIEPIDFRAGINRLAAIAQEVFSREVVKGVLFAFKNRRRTDIKLILYDGSGYFMGHKRLSKGKLNWWPRTEVEAGRLSSAEFLKLLHGVDPRGSYHPAWQALDLEITESRNSINQQKRSSGFADPSRRMQSSSARY